MISRPCATLASMRVLLTGATGFLGAHLVRALRETGHDVRALVRASSKTEGLEVEILRASFDDAVALRRAARDVDAVVHAAGGGIARRIADMYEANTESTRALLAATPEGRRFVLVSSLAAHGPSSEEPAVESDPDAPRSHYGKSKLEAERVLFAQHDRIEGIALRPPALYGPGEHRMVELFRAARRGVVPMIHPGGTMSMLHGADCARAVVAALAAPSARGVYYVAEPRVYGRREMAELIGEAVGRRVRVVPIAPSVLHAVAAGLEVVGKLRDRPVMLTRDKVRDAGEAHQSCDPSRATSELGFSPRHDFASGAREAYEDYLRRGWL